ncbi:hypothetical protein [Pseudoxanthomonas dokdonensis]|uniref:Membrane protein n=1 Tax=Pseudoxanthomonas dokdonensis TaxID=344882 RepID=A0A0R0CYM2_9GAMM|nr:hypothetical protein [Pseudoxanthomonas dokdonensis]KRG71239.1 membrane protein [Pseudoxanthomonas dokdonensis]
MNNNTQRAIIFALVALLLAATRLHLPASLTHFGPIPDASWAAFFIGGFYLRSWSRWAFPALMALAVLVDYIVIRGQGMNFWAHYCTSPAYWFLVPAYFALWYGGMLTRKHYSRQHDGRSLGVLVASLVGSVAVCQLLSQGSFYWISDVVSQPTVAGWFKNYTDWLLPQPSVGSSGYLMVTAIYVGLALLAHVGVQQIAQLMAAHKARA